MWNVMQHPAVDSGMNLLREFTTWDVNTLGMFLGQSAIISHIIGHAANGDDSWVRWSKVAQRTVHVPVIEVDPADHR